jgi:hypothetical protein
MTVMAAAVAVGCSDDPVGEQPQPHQHVLFVAREGSLASFDVH